MVAAGALALKGKKETQVDSILGQKRVGQYETPHKILCKHPTTQTKTFYSTFANIEYLKNKGITNIVEQINWLKG